MKTQERELFEFLHENGKIGRLRKRLIALLLCVEDIHADIEENGEDGEEVLYLAKQIELILSEFATSQQLAGRMIIGLTSQERKDFIEKVPEILDVFGWHNKIDKNGDIRER